MTMGSEFIGLELNGSVFWKTTKIEQAAFT
jgi:hypothetical protein